MPAKAGIHDLPLSQHGKTHLPTFAGITTRASPVGQSFGYPVSGITQQSALQGRALDRPRDHSIPGAAILIPAGGAGAGLVRTVAKQSREQEAIKQVAIGHRVTRSMPQSFTEQANGATRKAL